MEDKTIAGAAPKNGNFRASGDVENFYRFVSENGLRREAQLVLKKVLAVIKAKRKRGRKSSKKVQ